jgi:hypothetical protein
MGSRCGNGLVLRFESLQFRVDPPFRSELLSQERIQKLTEFGVRKNELLNKVTIGVGISPDARSTGEHRTAFRILQRASRPIVLGRIQLGAMVVYRNRDRCGVVSFSSGMMLVFGGASLFLPLTCNANNWVAARYKSRWSRLTARTLAALPDAPRGNGFSLVCTARVEQS